MFQRREKMQIAIITGLSGAGKTQAVICLEDLGYYCIDNMPPALMKNFIGLTAREESGIEKAAFVMDMRGGGFFSDIKSSIDELKTMDVSYKLIFLEAKDEVLIRRFNETRRAHPLSGGFSTIYGINKERAALEEIRNHADFVIDTSNMKAMRLREEIKKLFASDKMAADFTINIESFGFKNGIPLDADMVFDVRFIPNPFYVQSFRKLTGNSKKVRQYVLKFPESQNFVQKIESLISETIPCYIREGKYHLNIAFGCTGGQHRSVAMANEFADIFNAHGRRTVVEHRDL
jgi:UPF0042 nucleotide-binding protein